MKIVLDSNVIISAFSSRGLCNTIFEVCLERHVIIISNQILDEVYRTLYRKFKMHQDKGIQIINFLKEFCEVRDYDKFERQICRDKDDDGILALGKSNTVKYIISGDKDLLVLKKFGSIKILSPRDFWRILKQ